MIAELAPEARGVVGHVARRRLVHGAGRPRARARARPRAGRRHARRQRREGGADHQFINGPASFDSFDELLARTIEHNPGRSESSLRRGILHNAVQREDGSWVWRYARFRTETSGPADHPEFGDLWEAVSGLTVPVLLVRAWPGPWSTTPMSPSCCGASPGAP